MSALLACDVRTALALTHSDTSSQTYIDPKDRNREDAAVGSCHTHFKSSKEKECCCCLKVEPGPEPKSMSHSLLNLWGQMRSQKASEGVEPQSTGRADLDVRGVV